MCEFSARQADDEDDGGAAGSAKPRQKAALNSRNYTGPFRKSPDRL
ncbi:membrane protein insertion efficiency factor YidD, partial [Rhizobium leguminosarum]